MDMAPEPASLEWVTAEAPEKLTSACAGWALVWVQN